MPQRTRSRAYPAIPLIAAVEAVRQLVGSLSWAANERDAVARAWGYKNGKSGQAGRKIAALRQYGLLRSEKKQYLPTRLARRIVSNDPAELQEARREAFLEPSLFKELVATYQPEGRLPSALPEVLTNKHGISDSAKHDVAEIFLASGQLAGVLNASGEFLPKRPEPGTAVLNPTAQGHSHAGNESRPEKILSRQVYQMRLTGQRFAELTLPTNLNAKDLQLLRKHLELLEMQVEFNQESDNNVRRFAPRESSRETLPS